MRREGMRKVAWFNPEMEDVDHVPVLNIRGDLSNFLKYTNSKNLKYTNSKTQTELQQDKIC